MSVSKKSIARINKLTSSEKKTPMSSDNSSNASLKHSTPPQKNQSDYVKTLPIHLL